MSSAARTALGELRHTRTRHRLGDTEWFDVAYRVYLFGLVGLTIVVIASDAVQELIPDDVDQAELLVRGPATIGLVAVAAVALGLRSGADGGPISIEVADIRHVLLAPVDRRTVMMRPVTQRLRAVMFALALAAAILAQLVARELEGSRAAWAASGALFGAIVGALFVAAAMIAHVTRMARWLASSIGALMLIWQIAAVSAAWYDGSAALRRSGPGNLVGSIALWGIRQRGVDVIAIVVAVAAVALSVAICGGLRLEPLARRGQLVSQLRFAATVQDLRTVVMLRRQLRAETLRARPWGTHGRASAHPPNPGRVGSAVHGRRPPAPAIVWRRGARSLRRLPAARVVRIVVLAALGGVGASLSVSSSPLCALLLLTAAFLVGLESLEPLSQEVDRPDRTDGLPVERGWLYVNHLLAPAVLLVVAGLIGALAATVADPAHAGAAFALAIPVALLGATGAIVTTVLDASAPVSVASTTITGAPRGQESPFAIPEFAGVSTAFRTITPVVVSATSVVPVLLMRVDPTPSTVVRATIGAAIFIAAILWWVRQRDRLAIRIRAFFAEGRAHA